MRRSLISLAGILLVACIAGCSRHGSPGEDPSGQTADESTRKKEAFTEFLAGKTMTISDGEAEETEHVIAREEIEAVQFADSAVSVNSGPWETEVTVILKTDEGRFAAHCTVQYREVEQTFAFFELEFESVVEQ